MPWPFSESIKKRACRYLLHRYLGNFLQEKLSLDQLSLDLYQGTGSLAQVPLDKWSLNELLETADAPFEVIAGFIQTISLTVPWAALLHENCDLEVKGLEMVLRPRPRGASGTEPMCWSSFMTSSMQLAKECLSQKLTDDMGESFQPFEGLEKFAETIETVLRRVKVTFLETVLRVEHIPDNSKTGIALEIRIKRIVYCDETGEETSSVNVHQPTTFAHKNLQMEGITVFWDEFSDVSRAGCKSSPTPTETEPKLSPSWNPKIICEPHPQFTEPLSSTTPFEPVQIGSLCGKIELSLTLKNNLAMPGAKLDVVGHIDTLIVLLSPRQVHLLLDLCGAFSGGGVQEWAKDRKSRPIQQEDEYRLHMELNRCLKKDTAALGTDPDLFESQTTRTVSSRDDVFFSMADMDMSHSLSSLPPLGEPPTVDLDLSLNSNYSASPGESPTGISTDMWDDYMDVPRQRQRQTNEAPIQLQDSELTHKLLRQTSHPSKTHGDESRPELVLTLSLSSLAVSVLHIDPLPPPDAAPSPLGPMAAHYFSILGPGQLAPAAFLQSRAVFNQACPHDHLRFVGQGLKIFYEHCQGSSLRTFSTDVSLSQMEFLECLFPSEAVNGGSQKGIQYTELLTFDTTFGEDAPLTSCLHLLYKQAERRGPPGGQVRRSTIPRKAEIQVELGPVRSELDISIVDRLNSLLQPQKLATTELMASHMYTSYNKHVSLHKAFTEVFLDDHHTPSNCHVTLTVNAPLLGLAIRFPIPDLRSDQERGPWFKKSLQKEVLYMELEDLEVKTEFMGGSSPDQTKMELTFRELIGKFQEQPDQAAARFLRVSHTMEGEMTTSEGVKFDWPRIVLKMNPTAVHSILERITTEDDECAEDHSPEEEEEEGAAHSLKDVCDFGKPEPSPFSSRRVMYENEEMVIPGDAAEMTEFQEKTMNNSRFILELCFPNVQLVLPGKAFYEKLHNRINNDLLLWEPTAPSPVETVESMPYGVGLSVASQLINTYSKDSFSQFRSTGPVHALPRVQLPHRRARLQVHNALHRAMERLEATSELQSRLSSLSISSFPGITSKQSDKRPLDRLQNTDLSQSCTSSREQADMDDTKGNPEQQSVEGNAVASEELAQGEGGEENNDGAASSQLSAEMKAQMPPLKPPTTWTSASLKELKAKLRTEDDGMVTVYRGDIMTVHVPTVPEAKKVCWEFATDGYDIGFGIYFDWTPVTTRSITVHISESSDDEDEEEELEGPVGNGDVEKGSKTQTNSNLAEILPVYRQDSHTFVQGGSHDFPGEGTYLLKFDNSYSLWRNKTLYYRVYYSA